MSVTIQGESGGGPCVWFDQCYGSTSWAKHTGLVYLNNAELDAAYSRAKEFLLEKMRELVDVHGWGAQPGDDATLLLSGTISQGGQDKDVELRVPLLFTSFLDRAKNKLWTHLFENGVIFDASRKNEDNSTLFIDSLTPISDIFYLLQTLAPGMLLIVRMDEIACAREIETARALPSADWVRDHEAILRYVFGSEERYKSLVAAAADVSKSFRTETSGYSWNDGGEDDGGRYYTDSWGMDDPLDYLDCGPECGYCGHCAF